MNLLTPISLYYLIYRSAAARVYSVQCGFIYFTCVSHKEKKTRLQKQDRGCH